MNRIPQNHTPTDYAVNTAFLIQAHASSGLVICKLITQSALPGAAKHLVAMVYLDATAARLESYGPMIKTVSVWSPPLFGFSQ
ncbi:hypothetical protein F2Q70_00021709 [Brassica cretica]|nr:hypothetical protein F2Q70_00021709 [Brassica cretica]KAF2556819.1 hypothetical protein F2Q68_00015393 [Brassica cretica]VDD44778.1 unnamed protein product [Brassica oleracea]